MDTPLSTQTAPPETRPAFQALRQRVTIVIAPAIKQSSQSVLRWLGGFLLGGLLTLVLAHVLVEGCDLRFSQPFRHEHMSKVRFFQVEHATVDVVYLGSSQVHFGVMPPVIAEIARDRGLQLGSQFNLAVPGSELEVSYILARDTLTGTRVPRLMVLGVMPVLVATDESAPELVCRYGSLGDIASLVRTGEVPPEALVAASWRGTEILLQYPFASLSKPTRPFRWDHLRRSGGGWWLPEDVPATRPPAADDWTQIYATFGAPKALYYDDGTRPARVLRDLRALALERGCRLVVVDLPQHPRLFTRKYADGSEERYRTWMTDFCQRQGIHYEGLSDAASYTDDDFMEPFHLNARGADRFSRRLAELVLRELP